MLELTRGRRQMLVDKLPDIASVVVGALFFGQFLTERSFSLPLALFGVAGWAILIVCAFVLAGGPES